MFRTGSGWDIHRLEKGKKLVIGGVTLNWEKGCVGHSDGDALIHAIIDALLGAAGLDDIGTFFPDTDPQYLGIDSTVLLERTVSMVRERGFEIDNVDCTVILQEPKLKQYKQLMKERIASVLSVSREAVSVKAKTAEGMLGELGTGDAVCAFVSVLLS